MKRVVSISLGTSKRDKVSTVTILGEEFQLERRGTDGDMKKFAALFQELDGKVDALGVGGADLNLVIEDKKYPVKEIYNLVKDVKQTPVVDGGGLKHTLERETIRALQVSGEVDFKDEKVLLVSAVDRFGMAQAIAEQGGEVIYADLLFGVGLNLPLRTYSAVKKLGAILLPIITRLPLKWFYPMGEKQETRTPKFPKVFEWATFICGDWHYIRRYASDNLKGKTILTQTVRKADIEWLKSTGAKRVITTTPEVEGETFATNVMEGVIVSIVGKRPEQMTEQDYLKVLKDLNWKPNIINLDSNGS
jgi:hypothetical protein